MRLQRVRQRGDAGAVVIPTLIASLLGALLAVGGSIALVKAQTAQKVAPVSKPLVTYDQR